MARKLLPTNSQWRDAKYDAAFFPQHQSEDEDPSDPEDKTWITVPWEWESELVSDRVH